MLTLPACGGPGSLLMVMLSQSAECHDGGSRSIEQILLVRLQIAHGVRAEKDCVCFGGIHMAGKRISGNRLATILLITRRWSRLAGD